MMESERIPLIRIEVDDSDKKEGSSNRDLVIRDGSSNTCELGSSEEPNTGSLVQSLATSRDEDDDSSNNASSEGKSPGQRKVKKFQSKRSSEKLLMSRGDGGGSYSPGDKNYGTARDEEGEGGSARGRQGRRKQSGVQNWRNVRAVMAYYCSLRKIKRTKSNQRWMKLRTTVQLSSAISTIQKKPPLKREDSFLKRFSTRQIPETQETVEDTGSEGGGGGISGNTGTTPSRRRRRAPRPPRTVVNPDENFYFYWLWLLTGCVLYNLWTLIVRQSFPELQALASNFWFACDCLTDVVFLADLAVQLRTGYLEQGLMVYDSRKLAGHYLNSRSFLLDLAALTPLDLLQLRFGTNPLLRFPRFLKVYRAVNCYYIVESRTVYPNFWRVINLIHILLILAHWFGCFYFLLSEAENFQGDWVYPHRPGDYATLTRKYLGSLYWSTLTLTTIGDLPTPETNAEYIFTIVSYLIGVFIFATIVGQVGNVITNRNANRLEFERLLDGAKTYMRHHKVPGGMKRRVLRWYDYSWSRGRIQGGGDINTALGLLPDKLKTELALHVNLSVLKKVTIFQECQPEFLHDLVLKMKAYIFTPGDSICRKGEVAREMFIIADGILEVISETGRVLTTMKAGDFFGEIGILNLDGLNKRTADVRSVGYSELFSLSREDVLAAMKDYPEAQEILQTLGRKRLQEARNCSRKAKGEPIDNRLDGEENTGTKKIVHRLRSDVKGLRNALRNRSRPSRRSGNGESMELRTMNAGLGSAGPKGVLRRMPRVESDETHHAEDEGSGGNEHVTKEEKVVSPLGAGLPLLSRLKLLKEKQEREEKEANRNRGQGTSQQIAPALQPIPSKTTSEPEVIGAGLPLLQRLLLLKAKEDKERLAASTSGIEKATLNSNPPSSTDTISPSSLKSPLSPTVKTLSPIRKESGTTSPGKSLSPITKSSRKNSSGSSDSSSKPKVSFKDKIMKLQEDGTSVTQPLCKDKDEKRDDTDYKCKDKIPLLVSADKQEPKKCEPPHQLQTISIPTSVVNKVKSPVKGVGSTFRDKLKLLQGGPPQPKEITVIPASVPNKVDTSAKKVNIEVKFFHPQEMNSSSSDIQIKEDASKKSWSKLKKAAILSDSRETSQQSTSTMTESPQGSSYKSDSVDKSNIALSKVDLERPSKQSSSHQFPSFSIEPSCSLITSDNNNIHLDSRNLDDIIQTVPKLENIKPVESINKTSDVVIPKAGTSSNEDSKIQGGTLKKSVISLAKKNKSYASVEDLSPEYNMLPFVKKLKILYERQKLEELEKEVKKKRSSSLDCGETSIESETLIRCYSEGCTTLSYMSNEINRARRSLSLIQNIEEAQLLSPESNETLERRNLKSILKKLSVDTIQESPVFCPREFKKLIRAPTIEGYAARHSKFSKSVTFNRDTLTSPPNSANEPKPLFPISTPYHRLTNTLSIDSDHCDSPDDMWVCDDDIISPQVNDDNLDKFIESEIKDISLTNSTIKPTTELDRVTPALDSQFKFPTIELEGLNPENPRVPGEKPKLSLISAMTNQRKLFRGSIEEQEYFGEVLLGIKHVIQGHLQDVQNKFQERFNTLEKEVKKRDEIITHLQSRIQELERMGFTTDDILNQQNPMGNENNSPKTRILKKESHMAPSISSGSDEISTEQGFMRGDSLDTVFTTSPPNLAVLEEDPNTPSDNKFHISQNTDISNSIEEDMDDETLKNLAEVAAGLDLEQIAAMELLLLQQNVPQKPRKLDLNLEATGITYSKQRAAKLRDRRSWEESSDQESIELQDLPRSISPQIVVSDERSLLGETRRGSKRRSQQPFHLFGQHLDSSKSKIKKTLSVDTGIHHTGTKDHEHRKFSLGSFFGYHKSGQSSSKISGIPSQSIVHPPQNSVVLDMGSEYGSSDGNSSSTSSSAESDELPRTPAFEQFHLGRRGSAESIGMSQGPLSDRRDSRSSVGSGGDWEVLMLAEELERRERDEARRARSSHSSHSSHSSSHSSHGSHSHRHEPVYLRSLEEESDTPPTPQHQRNAPLASEEFKKSLDSPHRLQKTGSFSGSSSTSEWLQRRSRGLILRASSLEHPEPSRSGSPQTQGMGSKSSSATGHKKL